MSGQYFSYMSQNMDNLNDTNCFSASLSKTSGVDDTNSVGDSQSGAGESEDQDDICEGANFQMLERMVWSKYKTILGSLFRYYENLEEGYHDRVSKILQNMEKIY